MEKGEEKTYLQKGENNNTEKIRNQMQSVIQCRTVTQRHEDKQFGAIWAKKSCLEKKKQIFREDF